MRRLLPIALLVILSNITHSQNIGHTTDARDGQTYRTMDIGQYRWFKDNLRYETPNSWCASNACESHNYYYNYELEIACPEGWRVPSTEEWLESMRTLASQYSVPKDSLEFEVDSTGTRMYFAINTEVHDSSFLDLHSNGWVQGNKLETGDKQFNLWLLDTAAVDNTAHIHGGKKEYYRHQHGHHILDIKRRRRRFVVRCIQDIEE